MNQFKLIKLTEACEKIGISYSKAFKDASTGVFEVVQFKPKGTLFVNFDKFYQQYVIANTRGASTKQLTA